MILQSSRNYYPSKHLRWLLALPDGQRKILTKTITLDCKVCLIGDGQGADTQLFQTIVDTKNITSVNYDSNEVSEANKRFKKEGLNILMEQGDITKIESLYSVGVKDESQDIVFAAHVLEIPFFNSKLGNKSNRLKASINEKLFVDNVHRILKPGGEALVLSYINRLTPKQAKILGVQKVTQEVADSYGIKWYSGMTYAELSAIRNKEELRNLFKNRFEVSIERFEGEYVIRLKKK